MNVAAHVAYAKTTLIRGKPASIRCVDIAGQTFEIEGGALRTLHLEDEWFADVGDPSRVIDVLRAARGLDVDLFTFWQRVPDLVPRFTHYREFETLAVLDVSTYEHWLTRQINANARSRIRKAHKAGIEVREAAFDDAFVEGLTRIFNETPMRQGRAFWHYGKSVETVRQQFSRYLFRETLLGAYLGGELIGVVMLADAGRFYVPGQIISSVAHRDKGTNNALIAKAVEICAARGVRHFVYFYWGDDSLTEFKRRCGFESVAVPRYFVPISRKGGLALQAGLQRGVAARLPPRVREGLKDARRWWLERKHGPGRE
jgi:hypothetical protein